MHDPAAPLVRGDEREAQTRETYLAWMSAGLEVARSLAADAAPPMPGRWFGTAPPEDVRRSPAPPGRSVDSAALHSAVERGWVVEAPPDGPVDVQPAAGYPLVVKDVIDVAGLATRNGTPGGLWRTPASSAPAWRSVQAGGGRCVGKSATHEMAWGVTTPQIPHPSRPDRYAGGSSGGSAACVAAGVVPAGLGTDTGGSVRIPAALCGVVGFRPTFGSVDLGGVTPLATEQDVVGPLGADVATCLAVLEALTGRPCTPRGPALHGTQGMRVGVLTNLGRLDDDVRHAYEHGCGVLETLGASVVGLDTRLHRTAASLSLLTMLRSSALHHADAVHHGPEAFGAEARALLTLGERLRDEGTTVDAARHRLAVRTAQLFDAERLDAVVTPTVPCVAPVRGADEVEIAGRREPVSAALTRFTGWAPVTGMPAATVPAPTRGHALPVGLQVMARPGREDLCARVLLALEQPAGDDALSFSGHIGR